RKEETVETEEEEFVEEETPAEEGIQEETAELPRDEAIDELSKLKGLGPSKAEILYENGFHSLEDIKNASENEIQEVKGIGPALSEMIFDSLEEFED
ncbi:MAG: helix-hairpin-helix domain-containing protein, partial [Candidatus Thermoplasmatota archaeon]|nr:helix-hairpin-helix domain-containing protein [Candidatus Thermoplasmatota archaeon]